MDIYETASKATIESSVFIFLKRFVLELLNTLEKKWRQDTKKPPIKSSERVSNVQ